MTLFPRILPKSMLALGITAALAVAPSVHAAAFQLKENSAKGLGRAFAGSISTPGDAVVVGANPGAMRHLDGRQLQADLSVISFSAEFSGRGDYLNGLGGPISGGDGGDAGKVAPVPAAYFHVPFGDDDRFHFGMSLQAPFGFATKYDREWMGRYNAVKTELEAVDLGFAFSADINPYLSFGANVFVEHLSIELQSAVDFGSLLSAVPGFSPGSHDGFSTIKGNNNAIGFTVGGLFSFTGDTHLGISYRSKVKHKITGGDALFEVPAAAAAVLGALQPGTFVNTNGRAELTLPAVLTFSLSHRINDRWSIMGDLSRTAWKPSFNEVVVKFDSNQPDNQLVFNYDDTTFASIGLEYRLNERVTLRSGIAYDETPTSYGKPLDTPPVDGRDVRVPDQTRKWLSFGLSWAASDTTEYNFGYTHLFVNDANINTVNRTGNRMFGGFDVSGDIFALSINRRF